MIGGNPGSLAQRAARAFIVLAVVGFVAVPFGVAGLAWLQLRSCVARRAQVSA